MPHIAKLGRADAIHCAVVELAPVTQRGDDNARIHVLGDAGIAFKRSPVIEYAHSAAFRDAAHFSVCRVDHHELLTLAFNLVVYIGITGIQEAVALG